MKVAITTSSFAKFSSEPLRMLAEKGISTVLNPYGRALMEHEAKVILQGCVGVVAGTEPLTAAVMDALPDLKVISRCGVGTDSVDIDAAQERGILVRNTPGAPTRSVAEFTLALTLNLLRNITIMERELRGGQWKKRMGCLLRDKRVGIIGYGRIGQAVGELFLAMGCVVAYHDPGLPESPTSGVSAMSKDDLLAWADIVTLHCSKPKDGSFVLGLAELEKMKPEGWLVNMSRGGVVDEDALGRMLKMGFLAGAALDVFSQEPYSGPLRDLPQVVLTPHVGSYAKESRVNMEIESVQNLLESLGKI
jgi:D-3-phosphoglycerate dehydrogenase